MRMFQHKTPVQGQLAFDFAPAPAVHLSPPDCLFPVEDSESPPLHAERTLEIEIERRNSPDRSEPGFQLVRVLPWDFRSSFPNPESEYPQLSLGGVEQQVGVEDYHHKLAHRGVELLEGIDWIAQAHHMGVDPDTGELQEEESGLDALRRRLEVEKTEQEEAFDAFLADYQKIFGKAAAEAFGTAIRIWHLGGVVITTQPPFGVALPAAVERASFGNEEDGAAVDPSEEECLEITTQLADYLRDLDDPATRQKLLDHYAADFGQEAADILDRWSSCINVVEEKEIDSLQYDPGHPWHYYREGDAAEPMPASEIPAAPKCDLPTAPKNPQKRLAFLQQMLVDQEKQLQEDMDHYTELAEKGAEALSEYDRNIAHAGNEELGWASAIALKFNHIRHGRARVAKLRSALAMPPSDRDSP